MLRFLLEALEMPEVALLMEPKLALVYLGTNGLSNINILYWQKDWRIKNDKKWTDKINKFLTYKENQEIPQQYMFFITPSKYKKVYS